MDKILLLLVVFWRVIAQTRFWCYMCVNIQRNRTRRSRLSVERARTLCVGDVWVRAECALRIYMDLWISNKHILQHNER